MAEAYAKRERYRDKQEWRRTAFVAAWLINTAGKTYDRTVNADDLIRFEDEIKKEGIEPVSAEERKRRADESFMMHKKKAWMLLKLDEEGNIKVFGEQELERVKEKYRKRLN